MQPEGLQQALSQAFSLEDKPDRVPGALPQAMLSQPFGLKTTAHVRDRWALDLVLGKE